MAGFRASEVDIRSNARVKLYPASTLLQVANAPIFRASGWEPELRSYSVPAKGHAKDPTRSLESSQHRAKAALRDICLCNRFTHFFTWTLSPELIDRYNADAVKRKLTVTLKNLTRRRGFSYVCIPERHADGAIHMHGLCIPGTLRLTRARNPHTGAPISTDRDQPVFNMPEWKFGFSSCIPLDENYEQVVNYVSKYIAKGDEKIFGKWYLSSRNLKKKPEIQLLEPMSYDAFVAANDGIFTVPVFRDVRISSKQFKSDPEVVYEHDPGTMDSAMA